METPGYEQAQADLLRWAMDPAAFAREALGWEPDGMQERILQSRTRRGIVCCSRQSGKTSTMAVLLTHKVYFGGPHTTAVVVGPGNVQCGEMVRKAEEHLEMLGVRWKRDRYNPVSVELPDGARILGLPDGGTLRGIGNVDPLVMDEAGHLDEAVWVKTEPMRAVTNGVLWLVSTPNGRMGRFWETWQYGGPEWERHKATAYECPRISAEFLAEQRETLGERRFAQEYLCEFVDGDASVFREEDITASLKRELEPLAIR